MPADDVVELPAFFDAHVHFRQGGALPWTAWQTARYADAALAMPNTDPPVRTARDAAAYRDDIRAHVKCSYPDFYPLVAVKLTPETTEADLVGVGAAKLYPDGVTTNSAGGFGRDALRNFNQGELGRLLRVLEERDVVLCVHAEMPGAFCLDRERDFLSVLRSIVRGYPELRVVLEHVTTEAGVHFVLQSRAGVAATVTLHHLELTLDDVIGDGLRPHHFCKPVPKRPPDRAALRAIVQTGDDRFFLGSDSAPHARAKKECDHGCAGVYTAPVLPERLTELFARLGCLDHLPDFASRIGRNFYRLPPAGAMIRLVREPWVVPWHEYGPYVPYLAGETVAYRLETDLRVPRRAT